MTARENESFDFLLSALADKKGENILLLDLEGQGVADVFVLVTGNSEVHMRTLTEAAEEALERRGYRCRLEGEGSSNWRLLDAGNLVVHVFSRKGREFYKLEKLWGDATVRQFEPGPAEA